ncbi:MAG: flagellar hook-associated protein FlgL [Deltaproteobacteria bacterium]|nr:flagellar hook-associated protein FlgL [Deltaproteobacteria bacterium]
MRVTNKQLLNVVTRSVATSSEQLLKAQERVASMKVINRPSDDPIGMNRVLDFRKKIASVDQYIRNIDSAKTRVEATETSLESVYELLGEAKDIAISQSSTDDSSGRVTAAREVSNIYNQIRDIANTRLGGSYIFAGHDTDTLPFPKDEVTTGAESSLSGGEYFKVSSSTTDYYVWYDIDNGSSDPSVAGRTGIEVDISSGDSAAQVAAATQSAIDAVADLSASVSGSSVTITSGGEAVDATDGDTEFGFHNATYNGDSGTLNTIIGDGATLKTNVHGNETFTGSGVTDGVNILGVLKTLKDALEASVYDPVTIGNQVDDLSKGITQVEKVMSHQSTAFKRLEQTEVYWNNLKLTFENALSATEDADMAKVSVELQAQKTAYEMALSAAASVLEKNLLDFLG